MSLSGRFVAAFLVLTILFQVVIAFDVRIFHVSSSFHPAFDWTELGAMTRRHRANVGGQSQQRTRHSSSLESSMSNDDERSFIQLWLDLRGTAITPQMALTKLEEDSPFPVNKVLLSTQDAQRAVELRKPGDPDLVIVDSSDDTICDAKDPTIQYGTRVAIDGDSFVDPMPALETASVGGWVLIDPMEGNDKFQENQEAITNLVDFISSGMSLGVDSFSLGTDTTDAVSTMERKAKGGIAITCRTKAEMVQIANTFQSLEPGTLTTTESGILLKVDPMEGSTPAMQRALVLPFDMPLWKASALVLSEVAL